MATYTQLPDEQALAIQRAILAKLGIPEDAPVLEGMSYNSDGQVSIKFHIPRAELEAIINNTAL